MILLYILAFFIISIILFFAYIRIKYRFWAVQPVVHFYDIYYWFVDAGIIEKDLPTKNKYYDPDIKTILFEDVDKIKLTKVINLIHLNYIFNKECRENKFTPKEENISSYFIGHNSKCYWSFYYEPRLIQDTKSNDIIEEDNLITIMTGRPLHVEIIKPNIKMDVYYIDYLCVDKSQRKKGLAPKMIQTHEYNQRHANKQINVSLFKREDELTGIIPLCAYDTYGFKIAKWRAPQELTAQYKFLLCDVQNMYYLMDFININKSRFEIHIISELGNIVELVKTQNIYIYILMEETTICSAYFFRKSCTYVEKGEEVLSCIASLNVLSCEKMFVHGFKIAFWKIKEKYEDYKYLIVEKISHNNIIIKDLVKKTHPLISKTAYFFYNFAYRTFESDKVFILC